MPVPLSRLDAAIAARACRALLAERRKFAATVEHIATKEIILAECDRLERLVRAFEAHAEGGKG